MFMLLTWQTERRQAFAANGGAAILGSLLTAKPMKAFKIEAIRPTRPNAKRVRIIYGPYKLKGANVRSYHCYFTVKR